MTKEELYKLADQGFITDVTLIKECESNPELLESINFDEFVSQVVSPLDEQINEEVEPEVETGDEPEVESGDEPEVETGDEPEVETGDEPEVEPEVVNASEVLAKKAAESEIVVEERE